MSLPPTPGTMNFLPEDYVERRQATRAAVVFIGLLLVVVGGIVGAWLFTQWHNKPVFDENARVNAQYEDAAKKIAEVQELDKEKSRMVAKAEITTTLMERVRRSALLEELTRLRPKGVNFVEVIVKSIPIGSTAKPLTDLEKAKRQQQGLSPEPETPPQYDVTVELVGTAPTDGQVAQYIAGLSKSPLLADVNLEYSEEFKKGTEEARKEIVRKFQVKMKINPAADLRGVASAAVENTVASQ
jgi:Tfp pilus assembly protein PilN